MTSGFRRTYIWVDLLVTPTSFTVGLEGPTRKPVWLGSDSFWIGRKKYILGVTKAREC